MWHFGTWFSLGLGSARLTVGLDEFWGLFQLNDSKCRGTFSLLRAHHVSGKTPDQNAEHSLLHNWTLSISVELKHPPEGWFRKVAAAPHHIHISQFSHPISPEALNPKDMGAEKNGKTQQCQNTKQFMTMLHLPWIQPYQPQGLWDYCPGRLCMKKTSLTKAGREMCLCLSGWCVHACKTAEHSWTAEERRGKLRTGDTFTGCRMRLTERTRLTFRAVLLLTAATYKSKTPVPEFSITGYLIKIHIRQHRSRP